MKISAFVLFALIVLPGCSTPGAASGDAQAAYLQVSVSDLLLRASEFDGQPVRVTGVARFESAPEGRLAMYASSQDERRSTGNYIAIDALPRELSAPSALEKLSGQSVAIEGTFHARLLNRIPERPGAIVTCIGDCRTSGILEEVTRVSLVEGSEVH